MISFTTKITRNFEVDAWNVTVQAIFNPNDDGDYGPEFTKAFFEQPRAIDENGSNDGVCIATLSALMVRDLAFDPKDLIKLVDDHSEIGSTFDITGESHATAVGTLSWLRRGGAETVFEVDEEEVGVLIMTQSLIADAFVDRGAMLGYMLPHLSSLDSRRILVAHQEHAEDLLPIDQQKRMHERLSAIDAIAERTGVYLVGYDIGAEAVDRPIKIQKNILNEAEPVPGDLPLIVASIPAYGPENDIWVLYDEELEVLEFSDWAEARLGVRPVAEDEPAFEF